LCPFRLNQVLTNQLLYQLSYAGALTDGQYRGNQ